MATVRRSHIQVEDPIFHVAVHVLLNHTPRQLAAWEKRRYGIETGSHECDGFAGLCWTVWKGDQPPEAVVWVRSFAWNIADMRTLIHELTHVAIKLWAANRIQVTEETQEFFAWTVDGLFAAVAKAIKESEVNVSNPPKGMTNTDRELAMFRERKTKRRKTRCVKQ